MEQKKQQQERVLQQIADVKKTHENERNEVTLQPAIVMLSASCQMPKGMPAKEFLSADGEYIRKRGRRPYIDPQSERFDELPKDIQIASLERRANDLELEKIVFSQLPTT